MDSIGSHGSGHIDPLVNQQQRRIANDGLQFAGSYAFNDQIHFIAKFVDQSFDFGIDSTTISFGAGISQVLNRDWDFIGQLSYVSLDMNGGGDDGGLGLMGGVRGRVRPDVEVDAGINYSGVGASDTSLFVNGRYFLSNTLTVGGGLTLDDGDTALNLTVRSLFGRRSRR